MHYQQVTFFRPGEVARQPTRLAAEYYNQSRLLLQHSAADYAFVPIRSMQFLAVISHHEVIFVDSQGGYQVQDGEGGRVILLAWSTEPASQRNSLTEPVPIEVLHYRPGLESLQRRLLSEFPPAMARLLERQRESCTNPTGIKVVPLRT